MKGIYSDKRLYKKGDNALQISSQKFKLKNFNLKKEEIIPSKKMTEKITETKPIRWTCHFPSSPIQNQLW